jgi:DNA-binding transcriptional MerR regulator
MALVTTNRYYSSTEMIEIVGSTRKTLRVLEDHGLIAPARATGTRRYTKECLRRFWLIGLLRDVGLSLPQIAVLLGTVDAAATGGEAAAALTTALANVSRRVQATIRDLEIANEALQGASATLTTQCLDCKQAPARCAECATDGKLDIVSLLLLTKAGKTREDPTGDP